MDSDLSVCAAPKTQKKLIQKRMSATATHAKPHSPAKAEIQQYVKDHLFPGVGRISDIIFDKVEGTYFLIEFSDSKEYFDKKISVQDVKGLEF